MAITSLVIWNTAFFQKGISSLVAAFEDNMVGFMDTLPIAKELYPERKGNGGYKQETLVTDLLNTSYTAHNALEDVEALEKLLAHMAPNAELQVKHSLTVEAAHNKLLHQISTRHNLETLQPLITKKCGNGTQSCSIRTSDSAPHTSMSAK